MDMLMKYMASLAPPVMIPFVTVIVAPVEKNPLTVNAKCAQKYSTCTQAPTTYTH